MANQKVEIEQVNGLQTALDAKQAALGYTAENAANKSTDVNADQASNTKYPSVKAVYDWAVGLFTNAWVIARTLAGFSASAGTVSATDTILGAFQKVVGNIALKMTANSPITGATKTKITYDTNGLVTSGSDAAESDIAFTDITTNNASTTKHGYLLKATAPASGVRNIVAIDNGETVYKNTALLYSSPPAEIGVASVPGNSLLATPGNHVHAFPASTVFPVSPSTNQFFYRTDLGWLCYYDGTRWLTYHEYADFFPYTTGISADGDSGNGVRIRSDYGIYVSRIAISTYIATTNDGSHYWTITLKTVWFGTGVTTFRTFNTSGDTNDVWTEHDSAADTPNPSNAHSMSIYWAKTSTPGNLSYAATVYYRMIVT